MDIVVQPNFVAVLSALRNEPSEPKKIDPKSIEPLPCKICAKFEARFQNLVEKYGTVKKFFQSERTEKDLEEYMVLCETMLLISLKLHTHIQDARKNQLRFMKAISDAIDRQRRIKMKRSKSKEPEKFRAMVDEAKKCLDILSKKSSLLRPCVDRYKNIHYDLIQGVSGKSMSWGKISKTFNWFDEIGMTFETREIRLNFVLENRESILHHENVLDIPSYQIRYPNLLANDIVKEVRFSLRDNGIIEMSILFIGTSDGQFKTRSYFGKLTEYGFIRPLSEYNTKVTSIVEGDGLVVSVDERTDESIVLVKDSDDDTDTPRASRDVFMTPFEWTADLVKQSKACGISRLLDVMCIGPNSSASIDVQFAGSTEPVEPVPLCSYVSRSDLADMLNEID